MQFDGSVWLWRRKMVENPYSPGNPTLGDWDTADVSEVEGAYVSSSSQYSVRSETRVQALAAKSLFLDDASRDVRKGDGISTRHGGDGPEFLVEVVPVADTNPFTGWQPVLEVPLKGVTG